SGTQTETGLGMPPLPSHLRPKPKILRRMRKGHVMSVPSCRAGLRPAMWGRLSTCGRLAIGLCASSLLFASIDGTVINRTTSTPQSSVTITLVKPGQQGMQTLGTTITDSSGHFLFQNDRPGGGPQLLHAAYKGVKYNNMKT